MTPALAGAPERAFRPRWVPVTGPLRPFVQALLAVEVDPLQSPGFALRIAPHDALMLTVQFGRGADCIEQKGPQGENTWLTGIRQWTGSFVPAGDCVTLFALLSPLGAVHLLESQPLDTVPRIRARVGHLLDTQVTRHLELSVVRGDSLEERLRRFGAWLEARAVLTRRHAPGALRAARCAASVCEEPSAAIELIAARERITRRQLERDFQRWIGTSPRHLRQVARLQAVSRHAQAGGSLARIAAEAGFADQAHMTRSVRALTGLTPRRFVQQRDAPIAAAFRAAAGGRTVYL